MHMKELTFLLGDWTYQYHKCLGIDKGNQSKPNTFNKAHGLSQNPLFVNFLVFMKQTSVLVILILPLNLFGKQVSPDKNGGTYTRNGSKVTYSWLYEDEFDDTYEVNFTINFARGWNYMQSVYKSKHHEHGRYNRFIQDDPFKEDLKVLARILRKTARNYNTSETRLALSFIQALPYQKMGGYQRYAVETLIDAKGDCSDTSVLLAGIFSAWGYDCIFIHLPQHLAVGIWSTPIGEGRYYRRRGREFYYCETTGTGWKIGDAPKDYDDVKARLDDVYRV